jgi:class 3 adenylate cyclase
MLVCPACGESNPERARFCLGCAEPLRAAAVVHELRRDVSIIFIDLVGSTALGDTLDVEALRYVTGRYFETMRAVVERHGGSVEKFIGDAVVAVFGAPRVREDDALRAVRAALDVGAALEGLNLELKRDLAITLEIRVGVNTGGVIVGDSRAGGSSVTGDAVNVASRLEEAAGSGEVFIGLATYRLVRDAVDAEPVGALELKGKSAPVLAWRLIAVSAGPQRSVGDSQFVGRDSQLRLLEDIYRRVSEERTCQLVTMLGVAGIGKSRLAAEFVAAHSGAMVLTARCVSYGQGSTFWPLRDAIVSAAGLDGEESVAAATTAFANVIGDGPDTPNVVRRLLAVAGYLPEETVPEDVPWAVRLFLETLTLHRPVVLLIDDLHWAAAGLLDVLEHVADWSRDSPILVLGLARPEFYDERPTWGGGKVNATAMLLPALDESSTSTMLDNHDLPDSITRRIIETAGGNPLFVEQLIAMLVDEGEVAIVRGIATWVGGDAQDVRWNMPPTVSALLAARIDRLPDDERSLLGYAAVIGTVFYVEALAAITSRPVSEVKAMLGKLVRRELLRSTLSDLTGLAAYRFLHVLVRDAAYDGIAKANRASWHENVANWLDSLHSEAVPDEVVGHHLAAAFEHRRQLGPATDHSRNLANRAAVKLEAAARRLQLSDISAAASLLERAADLLEPDDPRRSRIFLLLAAQRFQLGEIEATVGALEIVSRTGGERDALLAQVMRCYSNLAASDDGAVTAELVARAIDKMTDWGDDEGLASVYLIAADQAFYALQTSRATEALILAIAHGEAAGDPGVVAAARGDLCIALMFGARPAEEVIDLLARILIESDNSPRVRAVTEQVGCVMHAMCGRFDQARQIGIAARQHLADVGQRLFLATLAQSTAHVEELAGDLDAAEREYERSVADLAALGESSFLSTVAAKHARLLARRNKANSAEAALTLARQHVAADDAAAMSALLQAEALLAAADGDSATARAAATEAIRLEAAEVVDAGAEACLTAADVERILGDPDLERAQLAHALEIFASVGNVVRAREVASRLATGAN